MEEYAAHMRWALELARRGWGRVHPNPMVGALVVRDQKVIGEGWHQEYGGPHAEIEALSDAGDAARGATLLVTLEPCAHHGKTPPCVDAVIAAGISRVIIAASDPNPNAAGGAERLRQAGIEVITGIEEPAARALNAAFFRVHEKGAPFVALKLAMSVDGGIAQAPGVQTTLTGPAARAAMHRLRAGFDAIMVGLGTALTDDPQLTVRDAPVRTPPVRVVADTDAKLPLDSQLVRTAREVPVWVLCANDAPVERITALEQAGVRVIRAPRAGEHIDIRRALEIMASQGVNTIFAEGGAALTRSLLETGSVHRIYIFLAPLFLGPGLLPAFGTLRPEQERWQATSTEWLGSDVLVTMDLPAESA